MVAKAVIQFLQHLTLFGEESTFEIRLQPGGTRKVPGGERTVLYLDSVGSVCIQARIAHFSTEPLTITINEGDVICLLIRPVGDAEERAYRLFSKPSKYLEIHLISRD
jgi:hypothetical protein